MMQTSAPGSSDGYILLDAIVALFIACIAVVAVYGCVSSVVRLSAKGLERASLIVQERNSAVERMLVPDEE